jgi:hypothetical protein
MSAKRMKKHFRCQNRYLQIPIQWMYTPAEVNSSKKPHSVSQIC